MLSGAHMRPRLSQCTRVRNQTCSDKKPQPRCDLGQECAVVLRFFLRFALCLRPCVALSARVRPLLYCSYSATRRQPRREIKCKISHPWYTQYGERDFFSLILACVGRYRNGCLAIAYAEVVDGRGHVLGEAVRCATPSLHVSSTALHPRHHRLAR